MTLLTICQDAARDLPVDVPNSVVASTNRDVQLMRRLADKTGKEMVRRVSWQSLTTESTFSALAQETQTSAYPTNADRIINETFFNRTQLRRVIGPLNPEEWQTQKALTATVLRDAFRVRGNDILMIPTPTVGDTMAFEYVSKNWVDTDSDSTGDAIKFAADTDTQVIEPDDDELITLGVVWRFLKTKGLDYAEAFREYELMLADRKNKNRPSRTLSFGEMWPGYKPFPPYVPEGSWGL